MIGALMLDIAGTELTQEDIELLSAPQVGGVILFARNIQSPAQVRALTDHMRQVRPDILIAVDQEGGRVQRLKQGFTLLPAMGRFGELYQSEPERALGLAEECGWLMATEVLAVGIDFSFAPVLDLNGVSDVIGDRAFAARPANIIALAEAFLSGMHRAGMATTGKHFPGHGSVKADSHVAAAIDSRSFAEIQQQDMQTFIQLQNQLDALMPAHVIYDQVDPNPAGFSEFWLQQVLRKDLGYDGVIFSDDLSMQAACVAGDADARIQAALLAGCDMGLVCNNRAAQRLALSAIADLPLPNQARLERMRGKIPEPNAEFNITEVLDLGDEWRSVRDRILAFKEQSATLLAAQTSHDPTDYSSATKNAAT
ncbi:beta-hexosaminidase [Acinetobacter sp. KAM398]|uniref:beta-N-acetylhexosaminidase n=1 Tax=unclassified Acinetobacter TaxID=196816 RepID=UPI001F30C5D0|nr:MULTISPECIES: beta-N-acetylhexosaminidase [unclassified Acinetobacter]GJC31370.1 beta-hexosaminidase [Acinetobacter sp. KAM392]GJC34179.1 beta-hexosaminidase [Acinetobacter sp. KAM393]GJC37007.1 beta-hexosaminidase [Acinetobacter sp. KAM394]GJC39827.1 beta-hexosaminidase [Acinetobacter sp. KAM395]GJC41705.1 beta-hexosaminidase [Acinetobacter sp. KAM396]